MIETVTDVRTDPARESGNWIQGVRLVGDGIVEQTLKIVEAPRSSAETISLRDVIVILVNYH